MITNIALRNFKCFREVSLNPKLVTVLIGPNGTGKSGVLQALLLLKQSKDAGVMLDLEGSLVQLSAGDFVNHGVDAEAEPVGMALSGWWTVKSVEVGSPVEFEVNLEFAGDGRQIREERAQARFEYQGEEIHVPDPCSSTPGQLSLLGYVLPYVAGPELEILRFTGILPNALVDSVGLQEALKAPASVMNHLKSVPAIRGLGRRVYPLGVTAYDDLSSVHGLGLQEEHMATTLAYSAAEVARVSDWMRRVAGVGFKAAIVAPQSVKPVSVTSSGEASLLAEGSGANALVHLLFELARAERGATVLIEEPEIHLHPGAQAELASVIAEEAKAAEKQVLMTTHSEHVAGRLLIEVAEGRLSPDDVAIYSFEKDADGVCSVSAVDVTGNGQVDGGLRSFFQTDLDEMRRYVDALRARA